MVVAITSGVGDMQAVLNVLWDHLLPAVHGGRLAADRKAASALAARLGALSVPRVQGAAASPTAARVSGRKYVFPANEQRVESVTLRPRGGAGDGTLLTLAIDGHEFSLDCRPGEWTRGQAFFGHLGITPAAASGAWADPATFVCRYCLVESTSSVTVRLQFTDNEVVCSLTPAAAFAAAKTVPLTGRAP